MAGGSLSQSHKSTCPWAWPRGSVNIRCVLLFSSHLVQDWGLGRLVGVSNTMILTLSWQLRSSSLAGFFTLQEVFLGASRTWWGLSTLVFTLRHTGHQGPEQCQSCPVWGDRTWALPALHAVYRSPRTPSGALLGYTARWGSRVMAPRRPSATLLYPQTESPWAHRESLSLCAVHRAHPGGRWPLPEESPATVSVAPAFGRLVFRYHRKLFLIVSWGGSWLVTTSFLLTAAADNHRRGTSTIVMSFTEPQNI